MHYYKRNTGDWLQATIGYSYAEQGILLRLIDIYHIRETGIPDAQVERLVAPRDDAERAALRRVLDDHFVLKTPGDETQMVSVAEPTWVNEPCERDIAAYRAKAAANRENGKSGGRPRKGGMKHQPASENHTDAAQTHLSDEPNSNRQKTQSVFRGNPQETLTTNLQTYNSSVPIGTDAPAQPPRGAGRRKRDRPPPDSPEAQAQAALLAEALGVSPAADDTPRSRLWRDGLATLERMTGKSDKSLRPLLGRMRDDLAKAPGVDDPDAEMLAIIAKASAEEPSEVIPWIAGAIRARLRPLSPCANDDAEAWTGIADGIEFDKRKGRNRPVVGGYFIDGYARDVCEAAGLPQTWRGDWSPLVRWLRDDIDGDGSPHIVMAIRDVASRPGYRPPASLAYFDAAVRKTRPAAAA